MNRLKNSLGINIDIHPTPHTTYSLSMEVLMRCLQDSHFIDGKQVSNSTIESWLIGYSQAGMCLPKDWDLSEGYEAGYAYGYAEGEHAQEEEWE